MGPFGEAKAAMALSYGMRRPCLAPLLSQSLRTVLGTLKGLNK